MYNLNPEVEGVFQHYRHDLYTRLGIAANLAPRLGVLRIRLISLPDAHFSEDSLIIIKVGFAPFETGGNGFFYWAPGFDLMDWGRRRGLVYPNDRMVYYGVQHEAPEGEEDSPRFCLRPLNGPEGWRTHKSLPSGRVTPRFRQANERDVRTPKALRHQFEEINGQMLCYWCEEPAPASE